jgi:YfiR/HmsC-like
MRLAALASVVRWCARGALRGLLVSGLLLCHLAHTAVAQPESVINREHTLKALFIYNFGSYVEWPSAAFQSNGRSFVIGVLGASPVESTLAEIASTKTIGGRRIVVERFSNVASVKPCQILFLASDVSPRDEQTAIERLRDLPVLIVGESTGFAQRGGAVNFFIEANKIRFEINVDAARQRGLQISAKLLALAKIVGESSARRH